MAQPKSDYLNVREAAEYLRVSERQVYRYRALDEIEAIKIGGRILFDRSDLDRFVERARQQPTDTSPDRCAAKIREALSLAPALTATQRRELAALLVHGVNVA